MDPAEYLWKFGKDLFKHAKPSRKDLVNIINKLMRDSSYWKSFSKFASHAFEGAFAVFGLENLAIQGFIELVGDIVLDSTKRGVKYELLKMLMPPKDHLHTAMEPYAELTEIGSDLFFAPCFVRPKELRLMNLFSTMEGEGEGGFSIDHFSALSDF
eukprot:gnl/MRDRNA2_/MRDRNA2_153177_c0_seq1.p1 gnl/MRDRNA2_/MRDRNA2_153177_c0~~gnl/MRDRNA2_/MRDRNA2_153177_c0_seq1.p1  ORF type:complete len:177 (+),score=38.39 gnl/MRDRNA2_/MRDRNA2_153177_c0_seq1:65-532(+)